MVLCVYTGEGVLFDGIAYGYLMRRLRMVWSNKYGNESLTRDKLKRPLLRTWRLFSVFFFLFRITSNFSRRFRIARCSLSNFFFLVLKISLEKHILAIHISSSLNKSQGTLFDVSWFQTQLFTEYDAIEYWRFLPTTLLWSIKHKTEENHPLKVSINVPGYPYSAIYLEEYNTMAGNSISGYSTC